MSYGIIYKITNIENNKCYIGQTTLKADKCWKRYKQLRCKTQPKIYRALISYGATAFRYEEYDTTATSRDELNFLEQAYIAALDSIEHGYNISLGGRDSTSMSKETRQKISETNKRIGKRPPSNFGHTWNNGRKHTEEVKQRRSEAMKQSGRRPPSALGLKRSEETKKRMSEAMKKRGIHPPSRKGLQWTEEQRRNICEIREGIKIV